jgi:hypothetical protein
MQVWFVVSTYVNFWHIVKCFISSVLCLAFWRWNMYILLVYSVLTSWTASFPLMVLFSPSTLPYLVPIRSQWSHAIPVHPDILGHSSGHIKVQTQWHSGSSLFWTPENMQLIQHIYTYTYIRFHFNMFKSACADWTVCQFRIWYSTPP